MIFFALCISFVTAAQDVERRTLDTTVSRAYEEQILAQKLNTRLSNTAIKYEHDKVRPNWGYKNNNITYRAILEVVKELSARDWIHTIVIVGSASPVGSQQYNHDLAYERARILGQWVAGMPGGEKLRIYAISAGEDWETFAQQVHAGYDKKNRQEVLAIIDADAPNDEKERKLYNLDGGKTWQILVNKYMALARNAAVVRVVENEPLAIYSNVQPFGNKVKPAVLILPQQTPTEEETPATPSVASPLKKEKTATPKEEKVTAPKAEKTATPEEEKVATPKAEKTKAPKEEKVAAPKAEKSATPKEEKVATQKAEKTATPKEEKPVSEVTEKPAKEKTEKAEPVSEKTEKPAKEKTEEEKVATPKAEKAETPKKEKPIKAKDTIVVEPRIPIVALRTNLLVPALNAGIEVPIGNHWSVGADYYFPWVWPKADNKNCFEFLGWGIEGRYWFGKNRTAYDRLKGHSVGLYGYMGYYDFERNFHGHQGEFVNVGVDYTYAMAVGRRKSLHLEFSLGVGYIYSEARQYTVIEANGPLISDKVTKKVGYFGPTKANVSLVVPIFQKVKPSNKAKGNE